MHIEETMDQAAQSGSKSDESDIVSEHNVVLDITNSYMLT